MAPVYMAEDNTTYNPGSQMPEYHFEDQCHVQPVDKADSISKSFMIT